MFYVFPCSMYIPDRRYSVACEKSLRGSNLRDVITAPAPELEAKGARTNFRGAPRYGKRGSASL